MKLIKKSVSVLLSFIMICSLLTIIPLSVRAEDGTHTLTVDLFELSLTNDYYENIAFETKIDGSSAEGSSHSVQPGAQVSVTARLISDTYRFHVTGMTMTCTQDGETKALDAELEILDAYRNVRAAFTMPSADARISFRVEEIYTVQVSGSADGTIAANRVRARKGASR